MIRLFCVTVYIFNKTGDKCLFMHHKKLNKWMPPGGKIDPHELPDTAAVRECFEETGAAIYLLGERAPVDGGLIRPYGMQLNSVIKDEKEHIDFIYLATVEKEDILKLNEQESSAVSWINIKQIAEEDFDTFQSVKQWVKILAQEFKNNYASTSANAHR